MMSRLWSFHLVLLPKTFWVWRREELWSVMFALGFITFLAVSHVSPVRRWPRPCNKTPLWRAWIWGATTSALKGKGRRLGVWWRWGHEGRGSEARPYESDIREMTKGNASQRWLISRCIHPVEICDDKGLGTPLQFPQQNGWGRAQNKMDIQLVLRVGGVGPPHFVDPILQIDPPLETQCHFIELFFWGWLGISRDHFVD